MKPKYVSELRGIHAGADIYVIGSGPSLTFIDQGFFSNKIVVCVNYTIAHIDKAVALYLVAKEPNKSMQDSAAKRKAKIVMCRHHSGVPTNKLNEIHYPGSTYLFAPKPEVIPQKGAGNALERSSSTLVTGLHLAAYMGCSNILLVGHDCGKINGEVHVKNYNKKDAVMKGHGYVKWMRNKKIEYKTLKAKKELKAHWGVNIYSLNPFVNFGLEGNKYERF